MSVKIEHYDSWGFGAQVLTMFSLSRSGPRSSMQEATYPGFSGSPSPSPAAAPAPATYNEHHVAPLYPAPPSSKVRKIYLDHEEIITRLTTRCCPTWAPRTCLARACCSLPPPARPGSPRHPPPLPRYAPDCLYTWRTNNIL